MAELSRPMLLMAWAGSVPAYPLLRLFGVTISY